MLSKIFIKGKNMVIYLLIKPLMHSVKASKSDLRNPTEKFQKNRVSFITLLRINWNNLSCISPLNKLCTSTGFTWHFKFNCRLQLLYKTRLGTMAAVCFIYSRHSFFALHSVRSRVQQRVSGLKHDCLCSAHLGVRNLFASAQKKIT
jgi:hypothetical protein